MASLPMAWLLISGAVQSSKRMLVWKNSGTLFATTVKDSPSSFMAHWDYGRYLAMSGRERQGLNEIRIADSLISDHPRLVEELSLWVRKLDGCEAALPYFRREVQLEGEWPVGRSRLVFCLLELGRAEEASTVAHEGVARGLPAFAPLAKRADSLLHPPR